jgi:hypothetical protein
MQGLAAVQVAIEGEAGLICGFAADAGGGFEDLARAGEGVSLFMDELFDAQGDVQLAAAIEALAGATLVWLELGELGFPEAQDVGLDGADFGYVADAIVEAIWNLGRRGLAFLS